MYVSQSITSCPCPEGEVTAHKIWRWPVFIAIATSRNRYKSNRTQADDPETGESVPIFNPRTDEWGEHFEWSRDGIQLRAKTSTGRATIDLLQMNRPRIHEIRAADLQVGRHPPSGDPIANK